MRKLDPFETCKEKRDHEGIGVRGEENLDELAKNAYQMKDERRPRWVDRWQLQGNGGRRNFAGEPF